MSTLRPLLRDNHYMNGPQHPYLRKDTGARAVLAHECIQTHFLPALGMTGRHVDKSVEPVTQ